MTPVEKAAAYVVEIARKEVGYREKASNSKLDDKTANAGSNNYTKYAAYFDQLWNSGIKWYNTRKQSGDWCDIFFDWAQCEAWGWETAMKVVYQPMESCGAGCKFSAQYYRDHNAWIPRSGTPKIGDQIFFGPEGDESHTGMVVGVTATTVFTIEGNSGNRCAERSYARSESNIAGYGRPDYALVAYKFVDGDTPIHDDEEEIDMDEIRKLVEQIVDERIEAYMGKMCKDIQDIPWASVRNVMRKVLDAQAIDGGTPYETNPDDIGMPLNSVRVLVGAVRYIEHSLREAFKDD